MFSSNEYRFKIYCYAIYEGILGNGTLWQAYLMPIIHRYILVTFGDLTSFPALCPPSTYRCGLTLSKYPVELGLPLLFVLSSLDIFCHNYGFHYDALCDPWPNQRMRVPLIFCNILEHCNPSLVMMVLQTNTKIYHYRNKRLMAV